jgi:hypothetical protein
MSEITVFDVIDEGEEVAVLLSFLIFFFEV